MKSDWSATTAACGYTPVPARIGRCLWDKGDDCTGEPVLLICAEAGDPPAGDLLFPPRSLRRIYRNDNGVELDPLDFSVRGRRIIYRGPAPLPSFAASDLFPAQTGPHAIGHYKDGTRCLLFGAGGPLFHHTQILVDYDTDTVWRGPCPAGQAARLPRLQGLIRQGQEINLLVLGDSISAEKDSSAFLKVPPYQPFYGGLLAERIRQKSGAPVAFRNLSVDGKDSAWGLRQANIAAGFRPDLAVIAFGMNDASARMPVGHFDANIRNICRVIRAESPRTEIVLVAGMDANPDWNLASLDLKISYQEVLRQMIAPHIAFADVKTLWDYVVGQKGHLSLTGNGVNHPNDYGHRLYADVIAHTIFTGNP